MRHGTALGRWTATGIALVWGVGLGGTFGCFLPYLLGYWHFHRPLPDWVVAQIVGAALIGLGLVPIVQAFVEFVRAGGTPVPVASPPRLVVSGLYAYVRNPIYVGFLIVLIGEALVFGSAGLLRYTGVAWCVGAAAVRFYEQPRLARKFGAAYQQYLRAVPAWIPRLHPWVVPMTSHTEPAEQAEVAEVMHRLRQAWRAGDIETYGAAFEEDADLVNRGGRWYRGRAMIADRLRELVRTGRGALFAAERRTESIRMIAPEVAIVHELWLEPDRAAHATYVLAHRDDGWKIVTTAVVLLS